MEFKINSDQNRLFIALSLSFFVKTPFKINIQQQQLIYLIKVLNTFFEVKLILIDSLRETLTFAFENFIL